MKLAVIADLHLDINQSFPVLECLAEFLKEQEADGVIIAGDITEDVTHTRDAVVRLEVLAGIQVWYVPGNHDMWSIDFDAVSTEQIYNLYEKDPSCLTGKTYLLQGKSQTYALIGDIGWYDYSFASAGYKESQLDDMKCGERIWQDRLKNQWTVDNKGCSQLMLKRLETQLEAYKEYPAIVVTHMLPVKELCVSEEKDSWSYFNGFLGSEALGNLYRRYKVEYGVCGHVHYRKRFQDRKGCVKGGGGGKRIAFICPCLGYHGEWEKGKAHGGDLKWQIQDTVQWIII